MHTLLYLKWIINMDCTGNSAQYYVNNLTGKINLKKKRHMYLDN